MPKKIENWGPWPIASVNDGVSQELTSQSPPLKYKHDVCGGGVGLCLQEDRPADYPTIAAAWDLRLPQAAMQAEASASKQEG